MGTYYLQVSAHGAYSVKSGDTFTVKGNTQYKFFVEQGGVLDYTESEVIYWELAKNQTDLVDKRVVDTASKGDKVDDYYLWSLNDDRYVSGVLEVGTTTAVVSIADKDWSDRVRLSDLITVAYGALGINPAEDTIIIYFNACREAIDSASKTSAPRPHPHHA